jgi:hypothetical protein
MDKYMLGAFQSLLVGLSCAMASADTSVVVPRSGSYSLRLVGMSARDATDSNGDKLPSCGDEARSVIDSISRITVVFNAAKGVAIVNGEKWTTLKSRSGTFAARPLTDCTSVTLQFLKKGSTASGIVLYVAKCSERPKCADLADYKGTFSSK